MIRNTLVALALAAVAGGALAADGAALYQAKGCTACHGANGAKPLAPNYPKLAGQNAAYLVEQVKDIRDGKRTNGLSAAMKPLVANITDEEIQAIADWLAKQ